MLVCFLNYVTCLMAKFNLNFGNTTTSILPSSVVIVIIIMHACLSITLLLISIRLLMLMLVLGESKRTREPKTSRERHTKSWMLIICRDPLPFYWHSMTSGAGIIIIIMSIIILIMTAFCLLFISPKSFLILSSFSFSLAMRKLWEIKKIPCSNQIFLSWHRHQKTRKPRKENGFKRG